MFNDLAKELFPLLEIKFKDNGATGKTPQEVVKELELQDVDSWTIKSKDARHAVKRYAKEHSPELYSGIETKFNDTFYKVLGKTTPFGAFFVAAGVISLEHFMDTILEASTDAKLIANFVPEEEFVKSVWTIYRQWALFKSEGYTTVTDATEVSHDLKLPTLTAERRTTLDHLLTSAFDLPKWSTIEDFVAHSKTAVADYDKVKSTSEKLIAEAQQEIAKQLKVIDSLTKELMSKEFVDIKFVGDGTVPEGKVAMKNVGEVFPILSHLNFEIPTWEWEGVHPDVPEIDPLYIFREDLLVSALHAIISNQRMYLQGHTGSGKTTLIEQVAAHLNWPFTRINFDSEITRMDLIGRDTLQDGKSVFVDGMLPRAMSGPYIAVFDELDFCRPDVSYVMQAALEGNGLKITEDGGREVKPNSMFRMFGTGNTVGQGDEHGMYQGARPQSLAFLDRFTIWAKVPYLNEKERKSLVTRKYPTLDSSEIKKIIKYSTEHLEAFENAKVLQPISPRGILAVANALMFFKSMYPNETNNLYRALKQTILDRATEGDAAVLKGLVDRV